MRAQLENEVHDVQNEEDDGGAAGQEEDVFPGFLRRCINNIEGRGDDERCRGDCHQRRHCRGDSRVEVLLREAQSAHEETAAEHKQHVG